MATKLKLTNGEVLEVEAVLIDEGTLLPDRRLIDVAPDGTRLFAVRTGGGGAQVSIIEIENCLVSVSGTGERMLFSDTGYVVFGTTGAIPVGRVNSDGFRIGDSASNKIAFYDGDETAQCSAIADATDGASAATQLNLLLAYLRLRGDIAT